MSQQMREQWWVLLARAVPDAQRADRRLREKLLTLCSGADGISATGPELPFLLSELERQHIPYHLTASPGGGYQLRSIPR